MKFRRSIIIVALLAFAQARPAPAQESTLNGFDEYVNKALKDWEVPGVAIAIVKNDQVVFAKGYGSRKLGDPTPVDEKRLFAIGSASKAFTAAEIAMSEANLRKFAGRYEMKTPPIEVSIEIVGGKLKAVVPGQPVYTLVPVARNRFQIEGFFVQFDLAEDKAKSLTLEQGAGPKLTLFPKQ